MIPIFIACLVWLPALVGLGGVLVRCRGSVAIRTAVAGLVGMFVAATIAAVENFFVGVYPVVSCFILSLGWVLFIINRRRWRRLPWRAWRLVLGTIFVVSLIDARGIMWYDTGLYHLQAVRWVTGGVLPRGLANLYECLGYNCSWFVFAGAVETPFLLGKSCFVVNAIVVTLIALPALDAGLRWRGLELRADRVLLFLMLIPLVEFSVDVPMMSSLSPDLVVMALIVFSVALWVRSVEFLPVIVVLALFAGTIKLSAIPFLGFAVVGAVATGRWRMPVRVFVFCVFASLVFLIRGIWISGYAAYPAGISRIEGLSWTVPADVALHAAKEIAFWSRNNTVFERVQPGSPWVLAWVKRVGMSKPMWVAYWFLICGVVLIMIRRPKQTPVVKRCIWPMIGLVPAMVFWFETAPQVRFGFGYIFSFAAVVVAMGISGISVARFRPVMVWGFVCVLLLVMRIDRKFLKMSWVHWPEIPVALLDVHRLGDGTQIVTPRGDDRVWDADRPATTSIAKGLRCVKDDRGRIGEWVTRPS